VSGCSMAVHSGTIGMVRCIGVPSGGGVVVMGTIGVTTLHPQETGNLEFSPPLEVVSPSSADSSRKVCSDGDQL
jgi:hypothetical protein